MDPIYVQLWYTPMMNGMDSPNTNLLPSRALQPGTANGAANGRGEAPPKP